MAFGKDHGIADGVFFLACHVTAAFDQSIDFGFLELSSTGDRVAIERQVAVALPSMDGGSRGMVGMVGLQFLDGQIGLRVAAATDVVADFLKLRKVVEDGGDGTGELVKGDLV